MEKPSISLNLLRILSQLYSTKNENEILDFISKPPKNTVLRVNTLKVTLDEAIIVLNNFLKDSSESLEFSVSKHPLLSDVLFVSSSEVKDHLAIYNKEVIVDVHCGAAVLRGAHVFAPGVLAASADMKFGDMVSVYADVDHKCRRGYTKVFTGRKFFIGNGQAEFNRDTLFEHNAKIIGVAVKMLSMKIPQPSFSKLNLGLFFPQNLPSILVGHVCNPQDGDLILDMCASPGGKTSHVAVLMKNQGTIIAIDKSEKKISKIKENCVIMGLTNVKCFAYDSSKLCCHGPCDNSTLSLDEQNGNDLKPPFPPCFFDKILLDPPCSGIGQRPQLRSVLTDKELQSYPIYQKKLFQQAVSLLKPGGRLIYSTCTLLPQENEEQVSWALKTFKELKLLKQDIIIGRPGLNNCGLSSEECDRVQRFDQCYLNSLENDLYRNFEFDTIGFFIACLTKIKY
ncbi:tRNA (cytosine(72)-C(5))-methyltransferase NSUN6 isoform X2 [Hydra vulgaris]|uniref:tRNA (Cytosine(72)-C(5))-methyltransferase NSUN6 isoform X2 n=1 Tax=Hydra vulgaris TaxID=6087 RepID=A0ABM4BLP1_HYDVU